MPMYVGTTTQEKTINGGYSLIKCDMKNPCQRKIKSVLETNRQFVFLTWSIDFLPSESAATYTVSHSRCVWSDLQPHLDTPPPCSLVWNVSNHRAPVKSYGKIFLDIYFLIENVAMFLFILKVKYNRKSFVERWWYGKKAENI